MTSFSHSSKAFGLDIGLSLESLESWLGALEAFLDLRIFGLEKVQSCYERNFPCFRIARGILKFFFFM